MKEWFHLRCKLYEKRKEYQLLKLKKELCILSNKAKFVEDVISETVQIKKIKKKDIVAQLLKLKYQTRKELDDILLEPKREAEDKES